MINLNFRIILFLLSYLPLFIIFFINSINSLFSFIFLLILVFISVSSFLYFKSAIKNSNKEYAIINNFENKNEMMIEYIFLYIIPFMDIESTNQFISFLVIFFIVGSIYVKSDLIVINPILSLFGYNIYKTKISFKGKSLNNKTCYLITKEISEEMKVGKLSNSIYIGIKSEGD